MENQEIKSFLEEVRKGSCNALDISKRALGDGKEAVSVVLKHKINAPERAESPARAYVFHCVESFTAFLNTVESKKIVFVDADAKCIYAVLDEAAEYQFEQVSCVLQEHPLLVQLRKLLLGRGLMDVKEFSLAVVRNRGVLAPKERDQLCMLMSQITVSQKIESAHGIGNGAINGVMCTTKVRGGGTGETAVNLPLSIPFKLPIYLHTEPVEFSADITIMTSGENVNIEVDCPELDVRRLEVFEQLSKQLRGLLGGGGMIVLGNPKTKQWEYIK